MMKLTKWTLCVLCMGSSSLMAQESGDIFSQLDKNEDGILVADEVGEEQARFFERVLRIGDKNEDGKLSKAEFIEAVDKEDAPVQPTPQGRDSGAAQRFLDQMFERMDRNGDGKVSRDEIPEGAGERMSALFDRLEKDELTKEELGKAMSGMGRGPGGPGRGPGGPGRGMDFMSRLDQNKDGKISRDEVPEPAKERMNALFDRLGKDEISLEEFGQFAQRSRGEGDRPRGGDRPRDGERMERPGDGDRPEGRSGPRDGERGEGDRPDGDRPRPPFGGDREGMGPRGPAFIRVLDTDRDGRLSKEEMLMVGKLFEELDENKDGQLDGRELMGFGPGPGGPGFRGPDGRPPRDGDRPDMERPRDGERPRPEGDRPREGGRGFGPPGGPGRFGPEQIIERFDEDKDGAISKEEAPDRMKENFDSLDENKDGKVTPEEFGKAFERMRERGGRPGPPEGRGRPDGDRPENDRPQRPE